MHNTSGALVVLLDRLVRLSDASSRERAEQLRGRLGAGQLRVALVGEAKRGKSTFGNALFGEEILPTGVVPVTSVTAEVRAGSPRRVEVVLGDGSSLTTDVRDLERFVSERLNPHNRRRVAAVTVYLPEGLPHPHMVLLDTPGAGSVHRHNTEAAREAYDTMDAAVFVLTADPPISDSEVSLLRQVAEVSVRVFVVLNKVDQLEPQEVAESAEFVSEVVAGALGERPQIWVCSARQGLRARLADDESGWRASGMADFRDALVDHLAEHRTRDLRRSIATAATRLAVQQLDAVTVTLAGVNAGQAHQQQRLAELGQRLDMVDRRREEADELVSAHLHRVRRRLDENAAEQVGPINARVRERLEQFLASAPDLAPGVLEEQARKVIEQEVRPAVEAWRTEWHDRLQPSYQELAERLQRLVTEAGGDLHAAARELLGVRLHGDVPVLASPELPALRFDFEPDVGWNHALVSGMRTRAPSRIARRRVERYLRDELDRMVDKHLGRARADFQELLEEFARRLWRQVTETFAELTDGLRAGRQAAVELNRCEGPERMAEQRRLMERRDALARLAEELSRAAKKSDERSVAGADAQAGSGGVGTGTIVEESR